MDLGVLAAVLGAVVLGAVLQRTSGMGTGLVVWAMTTAWDRQVSAYRTRPAQLATLQAPSPTVLERLARRIGLPERDALLLAGAPAVRGRAGRATPPMTDARRRSSSSHLTREVMESAARGLFLWLHRTLLAGR